jgi:hypothetical protein
MVDMKAELHKDVLDKEIFYKYQDKVMSLNLDALTYNKEFGRYGITAFTAARDGSIKVNKPFNINEIESNLTEDQKSKEFDEVVTITYDVHKLLIDFARKTFNSETLMPTYAMVCLYKDEANLEMHKDFYCSRYVLDFCLYQKYPWDFYVEGEKFTMEDNDIVSFYGEEQEHGRKDFPNSDENIVCNVLFFYAEPEDWFFTSPIEQHSGIKKIKFRSIHGIGQNLKK